MLTDICVPSQQLAFVLRFYRIRGEKLAVLLLYMAGKIVSEITGVSAEVDPCDLFYLSA